MNKKYFKLTDTSDGKDYIIVEQRGDIYFCVYDNYIVYNTGTVALFTGQEIELAKWKPNYERSKDLTEEEVFIEVL